MATISSTPAERVSLALQGREPDRVPVFNLTRAEDQTDSPGSAPCTLPGSSIRLVTADLTLRYPVQVLEQDGDTVVRTTPNGSIVRIAQGGGQPPQVVDWPLKSRRDWEVLAPRMEPQSERVDPDALATAREAARAAGLSMVFSGAAGFEACTALAGVRALLDLMDEDPGLVREVAGVQANLLTGAVDLLLGAGIELDAVLLFDEVAGSRGPLFPVETFRRVLAPVYRSLIESLHGRGLKVIFYSAGDLRLFIPDLLDASLDCLGPLETAAGMNLPVLKLNFGADLAFLGGIDRRALVHSDPAVLEAEIANKTRAGMVNGRYIAGFDGPLSADLPAEHFSRAAALLETYGKY